MSTEEIHSINAPLLEEVDYSISGEFKKYTPTNQKWYYKFPDSLEQTFQPFDDFIIGWVQRLQGKFWIYIDLAITGLFAIETGIITPFILYILGFDGLGTELSYLMLLLALFSQIPKRFVWRYRPYMVNRAVKLRKKETATTSSFPSRAVTCSVVYSFVIVYAYLYKVEDSFKIEWWMPLLILFFTLLSSFSRINLGVHYPTDCIAGFIQGVVVCILGTLLWHIDALGCASCFDKSCYSNNNSINNSNHHIDVLSKETFKFNFSFPIFVVTLLVSLLIVFISVLKPINFWCKCDRVYGMLVPGIMFQLTCLCPYLSHASLSIPLPIPWYSYFYALLFAGSVTALQFKTKGKYPVLVYFISCIILYSALLIWRLIILV